MPTRSARDRALLRRRRAAYRLAKGQRRLERDKSLAIPDTAPVWEDLTIKQQQVAVLVAIGHTWRSAAKILGCHWHRCRERANRAMHKLDVNLVQLARFAMRHGNVPVDRKAEPSIDTVRGRAYHQHMGKSLDVNVRVKRNVIALIEGFRDLAECGPLINDATASKHVVDTLRAEFDSAAKHLTNGTAPPAAVHFDMPASKK